MIDYVLTKHAETMLQERGIERAWLERVLSNPEQTIADSTDPELHHAIGPIVEHDNRMLRVVYNEISQPWRIVTAYFDRALRKVT